MGVPGRPHTRRVRTASPAQHSAWGEGAHGEPPPGEAAPERWTGLALLPARFPARSPREPPGGQRPAEPLVCPSLPAQPLQLVHGDRQVGDRRQAPGGWSAEKRLHDGRRRRRGAAGEEQAAAVLGLRAQFHGGAGSPRAPAPSPSAASAPLLRHWPGPLAPPPVPAGQTQTRPRGSGTRLPRKKWRGRAGVRTQQAPATRTGASPRPARPAGGRAGAGNLKIKSKQTRLVVKGERPESRGNSQGSHSLRFSLTGLPSRVSPRAKPTSTSFPGCRCEEGLSR